MKEIFKIKGFTPYIIIIFLNSMTDLGHKIILQNTVFKVYSGAELIVYTAILNALILIPFILLFSPSGYLSDKYPKKNVIVYSAFSAIIITLFIYIAYIMGWFWVAFGLTFLLGIQASIYSPAKYGLIKEMVGNNGLTSANGIVQAVSIFAILFGALIYSVFFEQLIGDASSKESILMAIAPLGIVLIVSSIIEFLLSRKLQSSVETKEYMHFSTQKYKNLTYLNRNIGIIRKNQTVWLSIIGLSIFWGISQLVVAVFGDFLKSTTGITDTVIAQGLLSISGLGMVVGSLIVSKVSKNYIEIGVIPLGAIGVAGSLFAITMMQSVFMIGLVFFLYGIFAGLFIVPLNALIQFSTPQKMMGKVLAGNNFMQYLFMFSFLVLTALFGYFNLNSSSLFYLSAIIASFGAIYTIYLMPQSLIRFILKSFIQLRYDISIEGLEHIKTNKGVLLLGNHISFLDWAMLQMAYPKQIRFVIDRSYYELWYFKPIFKFFNAISISPTRSKEAIKAITDALNANDTVALFPEGHLSRNGQLGTFQKGFELSAIGARNAVIIPFYLRGLWESNFSHASNRLKRRNLKDIGVSFGEPLTIQSKAHEVKEAVFRLSIGSWQNYSHRLGTLQSSWLKSAKANLRKLSFADSTGVKLDNGKFITATLCVAQKLKPHLIDEQNVALVLPSTVAGAMGNMAVLTLGKTIVNLNYSSGVESLSYAVKIAGIKKVITSKTFIERLKDKGFDISSVLESLEVIYLEDIKKEISKGGSLALYLMVLLLPTVILDFFFIKGAKSSDVAGILFSSGSEGKPKGIELTHQNFMGNIKQIITLMNPTDEDVILATLPIFHSFGLTVTTLLPLVESIPAVAHPDPTDGFGIGKMALRYEATIMFGTATFYRFYVMNKKLHPLMFANLRWVIAGAEKLPQKIRDEFKAKFNKDIYEGYGATETSPVVAVNMYDILLPDTLTLQKGNKIGSVGMPLPGSSIMIVEPQTFKPLPIGSEGMILIAGTQIMKGYLGDPQKTDDVIKVINGIRWYVSGDKGKVDEDGFLTIIDRYSRFAKISGEMVSLGVVEEQIRSVLSEGVGICAVAIEDAKKGEKILLLIEGDEDVDRVKEQIAQKLNPLWLPSVYLKVDSIPKLGSGKIDFKGAKALALEMVK
ncbi:MAG: acyl-[ACP]--phospholipid O-acyltransferase [Epsilonproteobacteria bacterium]|nr:acyl-[ACP]--phospholipid O-acyltransferase [Campylobacterota bacterium]